MDYPFFEGAQQHYRELQAEFNSGTATYRRIVRQMPREAVELTIGAPARIGYSLALFMSTPEQGALQLTLMSRTLMTLLEKTGRNTPPGLDAAIEQNYTVLYGLLACGVDMGKFQQWIVFLAQQDPATVDLLIEVLEDCGGYLDNINQNHCQHDAWEGIPTVQEIVGWIKESSTIN